MKRTAPPLPRLLSVRQLAERTGVPGGTWYELVARGELPAYRLGRAVKIGEEDAARYLDARRLEAGADR